MTTKASIPLQHTGSHGLQPWSVRPGYETYKSKFGPSYKAQPHFHGITLGRMTLFARTGAYFGAAAGIFALFFFADIPRVRKDIIEKIPIVGDLHKNEIAPEDNPF
ncbi:hypothetical protein Vi05172_g2419 [Venturia inaequalis]|nr:hypothetical protein Vi05172_g2419 [Venturia inaequalis]